jgi:farnesyl-diphosphate farnesyltransferase
MQRESLRMMLMENDKSAFYQAHLDKVSRSFAVCVSRLKLPLRGYVGLTYLLCRVLDTIEDAPRLNLKEKLLKFKVFEELISRRDLSLSSKITLTQSHGISENEELLLRETKKLISDLEDVPAEPKEAILDLLLGMCRGMHHFLAQHSGKIKIRSIFEVNQYCFFVAGIVGEALARIAQSLDKNIYLTEVNIRNAHHLGLFLQKVNILKDKNRDEHEGRLFVPDREELYQSIAQDALRGWNYIEQIPDTSLDYKVFCLWSFFLGLSTLPVIRSGEAEKLSRTATLTLFAEVENNKLNSAWLKNEFERYYLSAQFSPSWENVSIYKESIDWIGDCYSGLLKPNDFLSLGLSSIG